MAAATSYWLEPLFFIILFSYRKRFKESKQLETIRINKRSTELKYHSIRIQLTKLWSLSSSGTSG